MTWFGGREYLLNITGGFGQAAKEVMHGILLFIGKVVLIDAAHAHAFANRDVGRHVWA